MKRSNLFSETASVNPLAPVRLKDSSDVAQKEKSERDMLVEMIFSPDPLTGLPSSDIGMFINKATPPQVREYIQTNIFGDGNKSSGSLDVDDDTICYMTRQSDETVDEYVGRINSFMLKQKDDVRQALVSDYLSRRRSELAKVSK